MRVLLIAEEPESRMMFQTFLKLWGSDVVAIGVDELTDQNRKTRPQVILLDSHRQGDEGLAILRTVKKSVGFGDIPIVMCSASAESRWIVAAMNLGCSSYLVKPVDLDQLGIEIMRHLPRLNELRR